MVEIIKFCFMVDMWQLSIVIGKNRTSRASVKGNVVVHGDVVLLWGQVEA